MVAMSNYLEGVLIQHIFRTLSYAKPTQIGIALCTAAPVDTDTGALTGKEVASANGYARQSLGPSNTNWADASGGNGTTSNLSAIAFPTATGDWGTVTHVAVTDSPTYGAGNLLFWGALSSAKVISNGDTFQFPIGTLQVQLDD